MEERLRVMENALARIEEKLDSYLHTQKDHECRLRKLEGRPGDTWRDVVKIVLTVCIGAVVGWLASAKI